MKSSIARLRAGVRLVTWLVNCGSHSRTDGRDVLQVEHGPLSVVRCMHHGRLGYSSVHKGIHTTINIVHYSLANSELAY